MKNIRGNRKHVFAAVLVWLIMSMAMVCLADEKGTVKVESAKIRQTADTSSNQLGSVAKGGTVDIIGETTGTDGKKWYQVYVDANTKGFIRADLIDRSGSGSLPTVDGSAGNGAGTSSNDGNESAGVTATQPKAATVVKNGVRVRKSASTESTEVATVSRGIVVAVTGETTGTDNQKWYQVTFKHSDKDINGFIRADLVTFDDVPDDPAISEITGAQNSDGEQQKEQETQEQEEPKQEDNSGGDEYAGIIYMNVEEEPYIMPGFEYVKLDWNNQKIDAYRNGTFFIVYAQKQNGEEGWYLLDKEMGVYQRYPYTAENVTVPSAGAISGNLVPMIAMGAVIVILVLVILILFVKLRGKGDSYEEYDEDDDYSDDDIEDIDDLDDMDDAPASQPVRRPVPQGAGRQPSRRPPQGQGGQPVRRPAPQGQSVAVQGQNGQPRRPAPQGPKGAVQGQNGQPARRPVPQGQNGQQPPRRPAPQGQGGQPQGQRRPNAQNNRPPQNMPQQRGQKAKSMLANDEDDMDFIDI